MSTNMIEMKHSFNVSNLSPISKAFLAGSFSGTCSTVLLQPLDLLKTKIQSGGGGSMFSVTKAVVSQERLGGLWRGLVPSLARTVPGVGIYFASLHGLRSTKRMGSVMTGVTARCIAGSIMIPFTILKVRCEAGRFSADQGLMRGLANIYSKEGVLGLTKGIVPTLVRDAPFSGLYLLFYDNLKVISEDFQDIIPKGSLSSHFVCGLTAACLASLVTHPADVIKTRTQLDGRTSVWGATQAIYSREGVGGFTRGLGPRMLRRCIMSSLAWTVYETVMLNVGIKQKK